MAYDIKSLPTQVLHVYAILNTEADYQKFIEDLKDTWAKFKTPSTAVFTGIKTHDWPLR